MKRIVFFGATFFAGLITMWMIATVLRERGLESLTAGHEKYRQVAPDASSVAFVWLPELEGLGATISQPYQVWIKSLHALKRKRMVLQADKTDWILLTWRGPALLEICYSEAQISQFKNHFVTVEQGKDLTQIHEIEIILKKAQTQKDC